MTDKEQPPTEGEGIHPPPAPTDPTPQAEATQPAPSGLPIQATTPPPSDKEQRNWALAAHLTSLSSFVGIPGFIGPLIIWLVKKDEMPFASAQAKESLNFQITLFIYAIICVILVFTLVGVIIAIPGLILLGIAEIVFTIIASIQAGEGKSYRYPMTIRIIE